MMIRVYLIKIIKYLSYSLVTKRHFNDHSRTVAVRRRICTHNSLESSAESSNFFASETQRSIVCCDLFATINKYSVTYSILLSDFL